MSAIYIFSTIVGLFLNRRNIFRHRIIHVDYSLHVASLPRHSGLLQKNMSHLSTTFSTPLRGEFWKPTSKWVNNQSEFSRFMVKKPNGKSGFIFFRMSHVSYFMPPSLTIIRVLQAGVWRCVSPSFAHDVRHQWVVDTRSQIF